METVVTRGRSVQIPSSISELSPRQYKYYVMLAHALGAGAFDLEYFRVRWLSFLIGLGNADYTVLKPQYVEELERQAGAIDSFFVSVDGRLSLDFNTPINLLPSLGGYKGPGDWLEGVTYGEFVECLTVVESLNGLAEQEVTDGCAHIARVLYHIPPEKEVPEILAFHAPTLLISVWKALLAAPVEINGRKIDFRIIFKGSGGSKADDKTGWTGITFEVASAGLFGNVHQVEQTDMWSVLLYLYKCKFEYLNENRNHSK